MSRRSAREAALKILFQVDLGRVNPVQALQRILQEEDLEGEDADYASDLVRGSLKSLHEIDAVIERFSVGWKLDRMAATDRNVLRIAVYEILNRDDVPNSVSANEAVEIARRYGDDESPRFVNGILGNLIRSIESERGRMGGPKTTPGPNT